MTESQYERILFCLGGNWVTDMCVGSGFAVAASKSVSMNLRVLLMPLLLVR